MEVVCKYDLSLSLSLTMQVTFTTGGGGGTNFQERIIINFMDINLLPTQVQQQYRR